MLQNLTLADLISGLERTCNYCFYLSTFLWRYINFIYIVIVEDAPVMLHIFVFKLHLIDVVKIEPMT